MVAKAEARNLEKNAPKENFLVVEESKKEEKEDEGTASRVEHSS